MPTHNAGEIEIYIYNVEDIKTSFWRHLGVA
jgi:hypothetical protein